MMPLCAWLIAPVWPGPWWEVGGGRGGFVVGCRYTILPMTPDLMSPPELAEYLGLSRNTVYALLVAGQVPGALRFGRRWRISRRALERALHAGSAEGESSYEGAAARRASTSRASP